MKYPHTNPIGKFAFVFYDQPITDQGFKIKTGNRIVENGEPLAYPVQHRPISFMVFLSFRVNYG